MEVGWKNTKLQLLFLLQGMELEAMDFLAQDLSQVDMVMAMVMDSIFVFISLSSSKEIGVAFFNTIL